VSVSKTSKDLWTVRDYFQGSNKMAILKTVLRQLSNLLRPLVLIVTLQHYCSLVVDLANARADDRKPWFACLQWVTIIPANLCLVIGVIIDKWNFVVVWILTFSFNFLVLACGWHGSHEQAQGELFWPPGTSMSRSVFLSKWINEDLYVIEWVAAGIQIVLVGLLFVVMGLEMERREKEERLALTTTQQTNTEGGATDDDNIDGPPPYSEVGLPPSYETEEGLPPSYEMAVKNDSTASTTP